jgi:CRP-like cAMP-binding protein
MIMYDLTVMLFLPEDTICRQGTIGTQFFFLARGDCEAYVTDENKVDRLIHFLRPGSYFGEVALLKE